MQIFVCHLAQKIGQISTKCFLIPKIESFYSKYIDYTSKKCPSPKSAPSKLYCNSNYNCCYNIRGSPFTLALTFYENIWKNGVWGLKLTILKALLLDAAMPRILDKNQKSNKSHQKIKAF